MVTGQQLTGVEIPLEAGKSPWRNSPVGKSREISKSRGISPPGGGESPWGNSPLGKSREISKSRESVTD